jgi:nuclear transport factor 2 (NTF2) superfamily protein
MVKREDAVRSTYDAYNARDPTRALANLSADVEWDDGEGNMLHGKDAVARHWADQWRQADAKVEIEHLAWRGDTLRLAVRLDLRKPDGCRGQQPLVNTISFAGDLIRAMRIG